MSTYESTVSVGIRTHCDRPGCDAEVYRDFYSSTDTIPRTAEEGRDHVRGNLLIEQHAQSLISEGWTRWSGTRTAFMLCPDHKPSPTSVRMLRSDKGQPRVGAACFHEKHGKCPGPHKKYASQRVHCQCDCHNEDVTR